LPSESINVKIYIAVILPVVYGCETWSLALREEHRLRVLENREPTEIFGLKRNEVTCEWKKLHNEERHGLYSFKDIRVMKSRRLRRAVHVARMGESRGAYRILIRRPEGKRLLGRAGHICEGNSKIGLQGMEWGAWTGSS